MKSSYKKTSKTSLFFFFFSLSCVVPQEPQAALHVPNVRAECLLKFQLRPVMEWQRLVCPSIPPQFSQHYSVAPSAALSQKTIWNGPLHSAAFFFFSSFLTSSCKCQCFFFTVSIKYCRGASGSDVKRIPVFPRQCFCRQRCVSS